MKRTPPWVFVAAVGVQLAALGLCLWAMERNLRAHDEEETPEPAPPEPPAPPHPEPESRREALAAAPSLVTAEIAFAYNPPPPPQRRPEPAPEHRPEPEPAAAEQRAEPVMEHPPELEPVPEHPPEPARQRFEPVTEHRPVPAPAPPWYAERRFEPVAPEPPPAPSNGEAEHRHEPEPPPEPRAEREPELRREPEPETWREPEPPPRQVIVRAAQRPPDAPAAPLFGPPPERASEPEAAPAFITEAADPTTQIVIGRVRDGEIAFGFYPDGNIRFVDLDGGRYAGKAESARARMREVDGMRAFTVQIGVGADQRLQATFTGGTHDAETIALEPLVGWSVA